VNLLSYLVNAVNLFDSNRPQHRRLNTRRIATHARVWAKRHPEWATALLVLTGLLALFAWLYW